VRRATTVRLLELADELSQRDRAISETVGRLRLLSGSQIERLYFADGATPATRARLARRSLARMAERGVLGRLERRIGGVRAGAAGHVYYLAAAGQRMVAYWQGEGLRHTRSPYEPTVALVRHTLAVSESYVRCVEADRAGVGTLLDFAAEPDCWEHYTGRSGARLVLKPDARVTLGLGGGTEESYAFLEIDCATEGRRALARKASAYHAAYCAGIEREVFPRVVWVATTTRRAELIAEVCAELPAEAWKLFAVTTPERLIDVLAGSETGEPS
jgi:hypothetical protein